MAHSGEPTMSRGRHSVLVDSLTLGVVFVALGLSFFLRPLLKALRGFRIMSVWTGAPIINMAINARAERLLGVSTKSIVINTYFTTAEFDVVLRRYSSSKWWALVAPFIGFLWVCLMADRVHSYCDGGILPPSRRMTFNRLEMFTYRVLRIPVFLWTYGADVRSRIATRALGEPNCCTDCTAVGSACVCDDSLWQENLAYLQRNARAVFSMGDMIEYTPGSRNDLFFWPIDFARDDGMRYQPAYPEFVEPRPLRVVHAPNHRQFKGTKYLEAAVSALQAEGISIELILVEREPNDRALTIYRTADIVFDQCLIGFHGYFAIEAMALGKPVMCFIRDPERYLLHPQECPLLNIHRDELLDSLRMYATAARSSLPEVGRRSRVYAEKYFSMDAFASRLKRCYADLKVAA